MDEQTACAGQAPLIQDEPENDGVRNIIRRAYQCTELRFSPVALLPNIKADVPAGSEAVGVPYSSSRLESLYVPNCVSLHSYMTAIRNPNSYLYTRLSDSPNSRGYMGSVCSAFVSWCFDLPCVYTTHQLGMLPFMQLCDRQGPDALFPGCMLLHADDHVALVSAVWRDAEGHVQQAEICEECHPHTKRRRFPPETLRANYLDKGYLIYRFLGAADVRYVPTPWSPLPGDDPIAPPYCAQLSPRHGDCANWRPGEPVEIDVLDDGGFTHARVLRGETCVCELPIPADRLLVFRQLEPGSYRVCLTDGTCQSACVFFCIVDTSVSVTDLGSGTAKLTFRSKNAVPLWYAWCHADGLHFRAVRRAYSLTPEQAAAGEVVTTFQPGSWLFKVEFRTPYGVFSSDLVPQTISG